LDQQGHQEKPQKTTQIIQKEEEIWWPSNPRTV
jgi:hypothetical protein